MRFLLTFGLILILAGCAKSRSKTESAHHPGDAFTEQDVAKDRTTPFFQVSRVDQTDSKEIARTETIALPIPAEQNTSGKRKSEKAPKVEFLLNQMKMTDSKISVGQHAGLVRLSGTATVDTKTYAVQLEGYLKQDSTADLVNVDQGDDRLRAEVFCSGDVREGYFDCDSLFVDIYFKSDSAKFYREQLELVSEEEKLARQESQKQKDSAASAPKNDNPEVDGEDEIPDAAGTFVGRPERVNDLFSLTKEDLPKPTDAKKDQDASKDGKSSNNAPKEQPPGKSPVKVEKKPEAKATPANKPSDASFNNSASSGWFRKNNQKPQPEPKEQPKKLPQQTPAPAKPAPAKPQQPAPQPTAAPTPQPTAAPAPQPTAKPQPAPQKETKSEDKILHPAKVILEMGDEPDRPTDQAVGSYNAGKLENASVLPFEGTGWYFSQPQERHNYGAYDLIRVVKIFASKIYNEIMPGVNIRITDFGLRRGGHLPPHHGHQIGLEGDFGYLTTASHDRVAQPAMDGNKWNGKMLMKEMWQLVKFLNGSDRVSLIFMNPVIKPHFCSYAKAQGEFKTALGNLALRKIKTVAGHDTHFHLRMQCGRYNPRCRTDGPPAPTTGC